MKVLSEYIINDKRIITIEIDKDQEIEVKRKKRSKNANSYYWTLLQQLCQEMNLDVIQEYRRRVKELGIFRQWEIDTENVSTFETMWCKTGVAWFTEKVEEIGEKTIINAYYGSSSYNSKQFSRLLDNLVQDCRSVGVKTLEDIELEELIRSEYGNDRIKS